ARGGPGTPHHRHRDVRGDGHGTLARAGGGAAAAGLDIPWGAVGTSLRWPMPPRSGQSNPPRDGDQPRARYAPGLRTSLAFRSPPSPTRRLRAATVPTTPPPETISTCPATSSSPTTTPQTTRPDALILPLTSVPAPMTTVPFASIAS